MSQMAEDRRFVDAVAKAYARQQIDPTAAGLGTVWDQLEPDAKRRFRDRAIEILVVVDLEIERQERKSA